MIQIVKARLPYHLKFTCALSNDLFPFSICPFCFSAFVSSFLKIIINFFCKLTPTLRVVSDLIQNVNLKCVQIWSESGGVHIAGLLVQWLVLCTHAGGSPCWTAGATFRPPTWWTVRPANKLSTHLVPSSSAKWKNFALWGSSQDKPKNKHQENWSSNSSVQRCLYFIQRLQTPTLHCVPVPGKIKLFS